MTRRLTKQEKRTLWLHAVDCANEALSGKNKGRTAYEDVYNLVVKEYLKWKNGGSEMATSNKVYAITRKSLWRLMFWAKYGLEKAVGGSSDEETVDLIAYLDKEHKMQVGKPQLGKWTKRP